MEKDKIDLRSRSWHCMYSEDNPRSECVYFRMYQPKSEEAVIRYRHRVCRHQGVTDDRLCMRRG